jgi:uncharacterized protein
MKNTIVAQTTPAAAIVRANTWLPMLAFAAGLVFGVGLLVSGLTDPAKVLAFLDVAGAWDPALLLAMGAAAAVGLVAFEVARRRSSTLTGLPLRLPTATTIDRRLMLGGVLFGIGWGLAGICPGPSLVGIGTGSGDAALFAAAMVAGMACFDLFARRGASGRCNLKPGRASSRKVISRGPGPQQRIP